MTTDLVTKQTRQLSLGFENISQHNILVRHPMRMGLYEARIFALMLRCVHQKMEELPPIRIQVKDIVGQEKPGAKVYGLLELACKELFDKELNLLDPKSKKHSFDKIRLVTRLKHIVGSGYVEGNFSPEIRDYLLDLKENFTVGEIDQLMKLRNANSHRFYWVLKSWDDKSDKTFAIDEFREIILGADHTKYESFGAFNRNILGPAMEELGKVGFNVLMKPLTRGKAVTGLQFFFPKKKTKALVPKNTSTTNPVVTLKVVNHDPEYVKIRTTILAPQMGLTEKQVDKLLPLIYDEHHVDNYKRVYKFVYNLKIHLMDNKGTIHTPGAFSMNRLQTEYGVKE